MITLLETSKPEDVLFLKLQKTLIESVNPQKRFSDTKVIHQLT